LDSKLPWRPSVSRRTFPRLNILFSAKELGDSVEIWLYFSSYIIRISLRGTIWFYEGKGRDPYELLCPLKYFPNRYS
jgi:hypothetical protein